MVFSNYPDIVSVAQMSKMLGISEKSAYRLLQENSIEHFRVGRTYKIPKLHILNYLHIIRRRAVSHLLWKMQIVFWSLIRMA